jgi:hypothetical protein
MKNLEIYKNTTLLLLKKATQFDGSILKNLFNDDSLIGNRLKSLDELTDIERELFKDELSKITYEKELVVKEDKFGMEINCKIEYKKYTNYGPKKFYIDCDRKKAYRKQDKKEAYAKLFEEMEALKIMAKLELENSDTVECNVLFSATQIREALRFAEENNISEDKLERILIDFISYKEGDLDAIKDYKNFDKINTYKRRPDGYGHEIVVHADVNFLNKEVFVTMGSSDD